MNEFETATNNRMTMYKGEIAVLLEVSRTTLWKRIKELVEEPGCPFTLAKWKSKKAVGRSWYVWICNNWA